MLRLTLRSRRDAAFLARIIDREGYMFVLDYGDTRVIEDVSQKLLKGFTMWRRGKLVQASPNSPDMLFLLADYYAQEGVLVFLEEPDFPRGQEELVLESGSEPLREDTSDAELDDPTELVAMPKSTIKDAGYRLLRSPVELPSYEERKARQDHSSSLEE